MSFFRITPSSFQVNEGTGINSIIESDFAPGTTLYYRVVGRRVRKKDFAPGKLKGSLMIGEGGAASIAQMIRADKKKEGAESVMIKVFSDKQMRNLLGQTDAIRIGDTSTNAAGMIEGGSGENLVRGNWTWDGRDVVTGTTTINNTKYSTYFGVIDSSVSGENYSTTTFKGYADSNGNGTYDVGVDQFVGTGTLKAFATSPAYSGTFDADKSTGIATGYVGGAIVATATDVGFWFV